MRASAVLLMIVTLAGCNADAGMGTTDASAAAADLVVAPQTDLATPPDLVPFHYPIEHVFVIAKENHTFDNYFGSFPGVEGTQTAKTSKGEIKVGRPPLILLRDLCHTHECALNDWAGGAMNGWDTGDPRNANDQLAYTQYLEEDIPNYWQYARSFTLADHFFSSMLGPSFPGHSFLLSAQAGWAINNPSQLIPWGCDDGKGTTVDILDKGSCNVKQVFPCFDYPTLPDLLPPDVSWHFYGSTLIPGGSPWSMFDAVDHIRNGPGWKNVVDQSQFKGDIEGGKMANVVWIVDQDLNSEHPPLNECAGENWTVGFVNQIMKSPYWAKSAIVIAWDDFGGWYDHVPPPRQYGCDGKSPYGLGFRLPLLILSPYVKPHFVLKSVTHQGSVVKFIETIFHLPSLQSKDPAAQDGPETSDLTEAFDWNQAPNPALVLQTRSCLGKR